MCQGNPIPNNAQSDPPTCPFTIRQLNNTTYLIRENDRFSEYPHIYVKRFEQTDINGQRQIVLLINDTGVGTTTPNPAQKSTWTIKSFIDDTFNSDGLIPYLVILSHCHFDHILGLFSLLPSTKDEIPVTIVSSSHDRSFLAPLSTLEEHSLCRFDHLPCPVYSIDIWAADHSPIAFKHPSSLIMELPILTLHTPGHTPDSLSWYDIEERALYVGDSLYKQVSHDTRTAPWGPERPAPIVFPAEGNLSEWWRSLNYVLQFVEEKNAEAGENERVKLAAGHVSVGEDAQACLIGVKMFMGRVLRGEVGFVEWEQRRGERFGRWSEDENGAVGMFSVAAPVRIIEEGRLGITKEEWSGV